MDPLLEVRWALTTNQTFFSEVRGNDMSITYRPSIKDGVELILKEPSLVPRLRRLVSGFSLAHFQKGFGS